MPGFAGLPSILATMRKLVLSCLFAFACSDSSPTDSIGEGIHKGTADASLVKQVLLLEVGSKGICSSAVIHYPRCIITAAHCGEFTRADGGGTQPMLDKSQPPELYRAHDAAKNNNFAHDIAISWLKNYTPGNVDRLQVPDYAPRDPIAVGATFEKLAIESIHGKEENDPMKYFDAKIAGYGDVDDLQKLSDFGVLRSGDVYGTTYYGVAFRTRAKASENEICAGDSGGPLLFGSGILGISSGSDRHACNGKGFAYHTAFNTAKIEKDNAKPNYDWTMDTIEELCTKWQTVKIDGEGSVAGGINPVQERAIGGDRENNKIQCPGDCQENFHGPAPSRAAQAMSMTATPSDGWSFSYWSSESKIKKCQCDGSSNATWARATRRATSPRVRWAITIRPPRPTKTSASRTS
jgi:hypothetical protein